MRGRKIKKRGGKRMFTTMSVQLPTHTLLRLVERLRSRGGSQDISEAIGSAVQCWLDGQSDGSDFEAAGTRGYQWKSLFLPEGTVLRSWSYGEHNYARVEGDQIIHQGRSVSPNQFAQSFARSTRNAWTDLFVRRPGDKQFKLACLLRRDLAGEERAAVPPSAPQNDPASLMLAALLSHSATSSNIAANTPAKTVAEPLSPPRRDKTPAPGWDLPERRHFRYRLEDVAFD